jgi:hypothetical protein
MLLKFKKNYSFQINQDTSERIITRLIYRLRQKNFTVSSKDEQTLFISSENKMGFEGWIRYKYSPGQFDIRFEITHMALLICWIIVFFISIMIFYTSGWSTALNIFIFLKTHVIMYLIYRTNTTADGNKVIEIFRKCLSIRNEFNFVR